MLLKEALAQFKDAREAAEVACMGMYMALRWYERGQKRLIPPLHVLYLWGEHLDISDTDLGELIRDAESERLSMSKKLRDKRSREKVVAVEVERNRLLLVRDVEHSRQEDELRTQAEQAELSDMDRATEEYLDKQRRMQELYEKQSKILKELDK
jgi:transcriptional regulator with XRE-family HTH domain